MNIVKDPVVWINVVFLVSRLVLPDLSEIMNGELQMAVLMVFNGGMAIYRKTQADA